MTPHPPAVVNTTTFGPSRQRLGGKGGGRVERLLHGDGAGDTCLPAGTVEHLVVGGERTRVTGSRLGTAFGRPALDDHQRLAPGDRGERVEQTRGRRRCPSTYASDTAVSGSSAYHSR